MANLVTNQNRSLSDVNVLILPGSIDSMCGAAAFMRYTKSEGDSKNLQLIFAQAHEVGRIDVSKWPEESKAGFIGLPVNNDTKSQEPQKVTEDFVKKTKERGCDILFIADVNGKKRWQDVLGKCGLDEKDLVIQPQDRSEVYGSSCEILRTEIGQKFDSHGNDLLDAGNKANKMNFKTSNGSIMYRATNSKIADNSRREHIIRRMAYHETPDEAINEWIKEFDQMEANHPIILKTRQDLDNGIFHYDASNLPHGTTEVLKQTYDANPKPIAVVLKGTTVFRDGKVQPSVTIATDRNDLNLFDVLKEAKITVNGIPQRANLPLEDEQNAIDAVRQYILKINLK